MDGSTTDHPTRTRAKEFFGELFGDRLEEDGRFIELRAINQHDDRRNQKFFPSIEEFLEAITQQPAEWDFYYGINPRESRNGTAEAVTHVTCVWADLDWKNFQNGRDEALERIRKFPLPPTVVVESGHGFHVYWLFKEPERLDDPDSFRLIVKGVHKNLGSDQVDDLPRIFRVPGTLNYKDLNNVIPCKIIFSDYSRRFVISDFEPFALSPEEASQSHKAASGIGDFIVEPGRNHALTSAAGKMRRPGFNQTEIEAALHVTNRNRCQPPLPESEVRAIAESVGKYTPEDSLVVNVVNVVTPEIEIIPKKWPEMAEEAFQGIAGDYVRAIEPHTESDPAALLIQSLIFYGNMIGRKAHFKVEADKHYLNLFTVLVGRSSKARKGTAFGYIQASFEGIEEAWIKDHVVSGLSSGEGLIWSVRDPIEETKPVKINGRFNGEYDTVITDQGVEDKRQLVVEAEFASTLRVMGRDTNILSAVIRNAWDSGNLRTLTKNTPARATAAHISIIGHITKDELLRYLDDTEKGNGFGNRFLWLCVKRSKTLPEGGRVHEVNMEPLVRRLAKAVEFGRSAGEIRRDDEARHYWGEIYPHLSKGKPGLLGAMIARAEAQVMRLACIYALLDCSEVISEQHLFAALAVWDYAETSCNYIFGNALGDPVADATLTAVTKAGTDGLSRTQLRDLFKRNKTAAQINRALSLLAEQDLVRCEKNGTGGRPTERWVTT